MITHTGKGVLHFGMAVIQYGTRFYVCGEASFYKLHTIVSPSLWVYELPGETIILDSTRQTVIGDRTDPYSIEIWRDQRYLTLGGNHNAKFS